MFDYRDPGLADKLARAVPDGMDVYWQTSSHYDLDRVLPLLARGARVVVMAGLGATLAQAAAHRRQESDHPGEPGRVVVLP